MPDVIRSGRVLFATLKKSWSVCAPPPASTVGSVDRKPLSGDVFQAPHNPPIIPQWVVRTPPHRTLPLMLGGGVAFFGAIPLPLPHLPTVPFSPRRIAFWQCVLVAPPPQPPLPALPPPPTPRLSVFLSICGFPSPSRAVKKGPEVQRTLILLGFKRRLQTVAHPDTPYVRSPLPPPPADGPRRRRSRPFPKALSTPPF